MRTKELIFAVAGFLILIGLMIIMYEYYLKTEQIQVTKRQIYYDSLLLSKQKDLEIKDSIIMENQKTIKNMMNGHSSQIYNLKNKIKNLEKEEIK